jgi:thiol-disulfide isomerase/thioredoxin
MSNENDIFMDTSIGMLQIGDFDEKGVLVMSKNNPNDLYMIMVYANWCPPCIMAKPHYKALSQLFDKDNVRTCHLLAVNATPGHHAGEAELNQKLDDYLGVRGFPSFLFFKNGEKTPLYKGDRTVEAFLRECAKTNPEIKSRLDKLISDGKQNPLDKSIQ